jgi:type IV pilus assembly protein PilA
MQVIFLFGGVGQSSQFLLSLIVFFVLTPLFATRLYYAHARSKIGSIKLRTSTPEEQQLEVARAGGTSVVGIVVGVLIVMVPTVGGIIAAISIPAYNDYTVRAQVSEGLNLSGGAKAAVTEYYQDRGELPADNATAGLAPAEQIQSKYVSSVKVHNGGIVVTYGNDADTDLFGRQLLLQPELADGYVRWTCLSMDIEPKDLPAACRP